MAEKNYYCKACRGELEIIDNERGRCLYCGEVQPIPQSYEDEFNRANLLRIENKAFDEAEKIYRKIVENNPNDAEAHWGLVLCKYGIEYVDDNNGKKLPTCHRTLTTSILNDIDYKMALEHSSVVSRDYYERNAKLIDDYQIKISRIAKNEEDYDVFISFKARDDYGIPTQDSTYGHKFYNYLTKTLKLKVFFSDVTLKNRSGEEFEPIIYSALRSARAMILICGSYENINAPWVRNEWSRYISWLPEFNDKGIKKLMFTAIIDPMTPEKLPTDLQRFQCSKMSDLGAFEGICKHIADLIGKKRDNNKAGVNMTNGYSGQDITTKMLNEKAANLAKLGMQLQII
jgi:tetratricopeptide (TPR) repeat protein